MDRISLLHQSKNSFSQLKNLLAQIQSRTLIRSTIFFSQCTRLRVNTHMRIRTRGIIRSDNGERFSRCYRSTVHRIYEISHGGENAKATVIRPQESSPLPYVDTYICTVCDVYNRERARTEIWIILSCDCPCGDPIKIRIAFRTVVRDREQCRVPNTLRGIISAFFFFFFL